MAEYDRREILQAFIPNRDNSPPDTQLIDQVPTKVIDRGVNMIPESFVSTINTAAELLGYDNFFTKQGLILSGRPNAMNVSFGGISSGVYRGETPIITVRDKARGYDLIEIKHQLLHAAANIIKIKKGEDLTFKLSAAGLLIGGGVGYKLSKNAEETKDKKMSRRQFMKSFATSIVFAFPSGVSSGLFYRTVFYEPKLREMYSPILEEYELRTEQINNFFR